MENDIIPKEIKGKQNDLETKVELNTKEDAVATFNRAHKRMLNPPVWHLLCGPASAAFILTNNTGEEESRLAKQDDYLRIDIPGPGPSAGDGYDWVKIEMVEEYINAVGEQESCAMRLRASAAPGKTDSNTAHFFNRDATSSFIIRRDGNTVTSSYHGRNEIPNTGTGKTTDNIRNAVVAMGAFAFLSELQWHTLIKGFLQKEIGG